ncbi:LysR family transcriptional regulator [Thermocoleostomius sinensis]|jgi:DNA-binding transcriptional LysR family regulator|uniref:LysR family transcriptional regulator n=1 Tax=Thermocoleostomius sinensis A174 TaxID=2016057 RepID=A0A9E9C9H2_9CYAN|nr:LysR family transcriptional regulator [Thermocoleostomius sinensis]WAL62704.1 LysR family transcriptional regulator [Thermocoleostomius sinensis A174]
MSEINLKISQLRAFVAVATCQNFSAAALDLGVSQSTVSHAIATLEEELGVLLLMRGRHGATLTPIGQEILSDARQILGLLESIATKANLDRGLQSGQVRVAAVRSIATHILPKVIAQFCRKFPMVQVVLVEYDRYLEVEQALRDGQADIGFTVLPTAPEFDTWILFYDEFVVLLPPTTDKDDRPLTWEQLAQLPMIINQRSVHHNRVVDEHLAQFGQTRQIAYRVREDSTISSMIQQGLGAAIIARLVAEPIPDEIQVKHLPVPLERVIGVAILANSLLPSATFAFLDVAKAVWCPVATPPASKLL